MGQSELFKPFENMMFLLAKGGIYTQKHFHWLPVRLFFWEEKVCMRMLSIGMEAF